MESKSLTVFFFLASLVSILSPSIMAKSGDAAAAPAPFSVQSDLDAVTPSDPTIPIVYVISVDWPAKVDRTAYAISLMAPVLGEAAAKKALIGTYVSVPSFGATLTGLQVTAMLKNPAVLSAWPTSEFYLGVLKKYDEDIVPKGN